MTSLRCPNVNDLTKAAGSSPVESESAEGDLDSRIHVASVQPADLPSLLAAPRPISVDALTDACGAGLTGDRSDLAAACAQAIQEPGKQLRARLVVAAARFGERPNDPAVLQAATGLELFHGATLVHDDVVDDGTLRRGDVAVRQQFGNVTSGLAGAALFARSVAVLAGCGPAAAGAFADTVEQVCDGQMSELSDAQLLTRTADEYLLAVDGKTASLLSLAGRVGAITSGAAPWLQDTLGKYGLNLGRAFQISDDILDIIGTVADLGKPPGSDLRHGIYTLPMILGMEADEDLVEVLNECTDDHHVDDALRAIKASGGIKRAQARCYTYSDAACAALDGVPDTGDLVVQLQELARWVGDRSLKLQEGT